MDKILDKVLEWLVCDCCEDICKLCVHEEESNEEWTDDIPEDVEPCKFRRECGNEACKRGISAWFAQKN